MKMSISLCIRIGIKAKAAPKIWLPTFPIKSLAGKTLKYKKTKRAPIKVAMKPDRDL